MLKLLIYAKVTYPNCKPNPPIKCLNADFLYQHGGDGMDSRDKCKKTGEIMGR